MNIKSKQRSLLAGLLLAAAGIINTHAANSTIVTFSVDMATNIANLTFNPATDTVYARGTFDGWATPGLALVQENGGTVYTNSANDTSDANGGTMNWQYTFIDNGTTTYEGGPANRCAALPATSGASLILPTPYFNDAGGPVITSVTFQVDMSQQIALGNFNPTNGYVAAYGGQEGSFANWGSQFVLTNNPSIIVTNQYGLESSNVWVNTYSVTNSPYGKFEFKYVMTNTLGILTYEQPGSLDSDYDYNNNRYFVLTNLLNETLPLVNFSDAAYAPIVNVQFAVDMSGIVLSDPNYDPTTVTLNGDFNGWTTAIGCTNNPTAANTNIFYSTNIVAGVGQTINYQFRYTSAGNLVYDGAPGGGNRQYVVPNVNPAEVPPVFFANISPADLLNEDTTVTFSIDMTNAVSAGNPGVTFDPVNDPVYINGDFSGWQAWNPPALAGLQAAATGTSEIYTYSQLFPKGSPRVVNYLWVFDDVDGSTGIVYESGNNNRIRYLRTTNGVDVLPTDVWGVGLPNGNRLQESKVGNVSIGKPAGGSVQLNWLGYPGLSLQSATSINGGWQNVPGSDTQNSANVSTAPSQQYFRLNLVQPAP
jgi:hypothetical protein